MSAAGSVMYRCAPRKVPPQQAKIDQAVQTLLSIKAAPTQPWVSLQTLLRRSSRGKARFPDSRCNSRNVINAICAKGGPERREHRLRPPVPLQTHPEAHRAICAVRSRDVINAICAKGGLELRAAPLRPPAPGQMCRALHRATSAVLSRDVISALFERDGPEHQVHRQRLLVLHQMRRPIARRANCAARGPKNAINVI